MGCGWILSALTGDRIAQTQLSAGHHQNTYFFPVIFQFQTLSFPAAEVPLFSKDPTIHEAGQVFRGGEIMQPLLGKLPAPLTTQLENVANFIHWGVLGGLIGFSGHNVLYIGWVEGD